MKKLMKVVCSALLFVSIAGVSATGMAAPLGESYSSSSVSIKTHKWMDAENYYLGVILDGIKPEQLQVQPHARSLSLRARYEERKQSGSSMSSSSGSANVSATLPRDADVSKIRKVVTGRDLVIVIPRRRY